MKNENQEKSNVLISPSKPYFGGYRNKLTGQIYHHAKVQTDPPPWKHIQIERFHRCVQTVKEQNESQQTACDAWTQLGISHLNKLTTEDKILIPSRRYISADVIKKVQTNAIIVIQKYWRRWLAKKELLRRKNAAYMRIAWDEEQDRLKKKEEEDWLNELEYRKKHPNSKDDFTLLFSELQKWWEHEVDDLKTTSSGPNLKASLWMLVDDEIRKIESIERERQKVQKFQAMEKRHTFLLKAAAPKIWKAYKKPIQVETAGSQTAKFLKDLYTTLTKPKLVPEDRISALMMLKECIKPYNCQLRDELIALANREIDLLTRGTKDKNLTGLRARIRNLFWQFVREPAFNPEAKRFSKLDTLLEKMPHVPLCSSCNQHYILPRDSLEESANCSVLKQRFTKCQRCKYLENEGWIRKDLEIYKRMLKLLITEEEKQESTSGIIYLLQPHDICYMVEKIWKSQSCISGLSVLKDLEFIRWNIDNNWTPWNCILMTRIEAQNHKKIKNYKEMYDDAFLESIRLKHIEARRYISSIPRFLPYLQCDL